MIARPHASSGQPQGATVAIRFGRRFRVKASVRIEPAGLLAVASLVSATLLSTAVLVRAARGRPSRPPPPRLADGDMAEQGPVSRAAGR